MRKFGIIVCGWLVMTAKNHLVSFIDRPKGQSNSLLNRFQLDALLSF